MRCCTQLVRKIDESRKEQPRRQYQSSWTWGASGGAVCLWRGAGSGARRLRAGGGRGAERKRDSRCAVLLCLHLCQQSILSLNGLLLDRSRAAAQLCPKIYANVPERSASLDKERKTITVAASRSRPCLAACAAVGDEGSAARLLLALARSFSSVALYCCAAREVYCTAAGDWHVSFRCTSVRGAASLFQL